MNLLRMRLKSAEHLKTALGAAKDSKVHVSSWEEEEIEIAFEAGYKAGYNDGGADATRRVSSPEDKEPA